MPSVLHPSWIGHSTIHCNIQFFFHGAIFGSILVCNKSRMVVVQRKNKESFLVAAQFVNCLFLCTAQCSVQRNVVKINFQCTAVQWFSACLTPFFGCNNRLRWASALVITNFIAANRFQQFRIIKSLYFSLPRMIRVTEFLCKCTFAPKYPPHTIFCSRHPSPNLLKVGFVKLKS